ncbi:hypothetical protein SCUP515_07373 [Seiridium cupressi]
MAQFPNISNELRQANVALYGRRLRREGKEDGFVNDDVVAIVVEADRIQWEPGHREDMDEDDEDDKMWQYVRPDAVAYLYDLLTHMTKFWERVFVYPSQVYNGA